MRKSDLKIPALFPEDDLGVKRHARLRLPPPVPDTGWQRPASPPNLSNAVLLAFDTETKDTELNTAGPGWARGAAHIVGVSLAAEDRLGNRGAWYFPLRHEFAPQDNIDPALFFEWLKPVMATNIPKIGTNLTYDIGNLSDENIEVNGELHDITFAEALLDEEAYVSLDYQAHKYLGRHKTTDLLYEWQREAYPNTAERHRRGDIYRSPARLVGPYAEDDAILPLDIWRKQIPLIHAEELDYVYRLECDLIPLMVAMRREGVSVDVNAAEKLLVELEAETRLLYKKIYQDYGRNIASTDSREIGPLLDHVGIDVPRTAAGNLSVQKEWLAGLDHPLGKLLNEIREHEKMCGTFIKSYILEKNVNGKVYPQFHQLKNRDETGESGTGVGRFASSDPNLQNIPSRTKLGKRVRECFIPDKGHKYWRKHDYSQIHYRILAHYAVDDGDGSAEALRESYRNDPNMDYHDNVYYNVCPLLGWDASDEDAKDFRRRPIKNVNFGLLYGQSEKALKYKTASYFGEGFGEAEANAFFKAYFEGAPYVKPTMKEIGKEVQQYGFVRTILNRRVRFREWEPIVKEKGKFYPPLPYEEALRAYGPSIKRAYEYRGVNYKFQGSEPDIMKHGMRECYRSGVFKYTGVPRVTVHDELGWSQIDDSPEMIEAFDFIKHTMENTIKLSVPIRVDATLGDNWGKAK